MLQFYHVMLTIVCIIIEQLSGSQQEQCDLCVNKSITPEDIKDRVQNGFPPAPNRELSPSALPNINNPSALPDINNPNALPDINNLQAVGAGYAIESIGPTISDSQINNGQNQDQADQQDV